jgi:hypothetical protein
MLILACLGTALIFAILGAIAQVIGFAWLERLCLYGGTILAGCGAAAGIGGVIGLVWPAATAAATFILCVLWAWFGWRYATQRDRQRSRREGAG